MTRDDDLVEHLRHLARSTPPSTLDREEVLRRGRRRRATRAGGVGVTVLAAVVASGVGVHALVTPAPQPVPLAEPTTTPPTTTPVDPAVVFDEASGTVAEPLDAFQWSDQEMLVVWAAQGHFRDQCLAAAGPLDGTRFSASPGTVVSRAKDDGFAVYGLWSPSQAEGTAYVPDRLGDMYKGGGALANYGGRDDELTAAQKRCFTETVAAGLDYEAAALDAMGPDLSHLVSPLGTEEGRAVVVEWVGCIEAEGLTASTENHPMRPLRLVPDRTVEVTPDERRQMAAVDLGCKERLGTVEAYADIVAREQNAYIARARERLEVEKTIQERVLAASVAYLEREGVEVPPMP